MAEPRFWAATGRTFLLVFLTVPLEVALGLGLALLLHRNLPLRGAVRAAALVPWALPAVVVALFWRWLFHDVAGPAAAVLAALGLGGAPLATPAGAWAVLVAAEVWKTTPFVALVLLAGLAAVPPDLEDAAAVDGARPWATFRHVTLPLLAPAIAAAACLRALDAWRAFDTIWVLTGGGPSSATETLPLYVYQVLFGRLDLGRGAAAAIASVAGAAPLAAGALSIGRLRER